MKTGLFIYFDNTGYLLAFLELTQKMHAEIHIMSSLCSSELI